MQNPESAPIKATQESSTQEPAKQERFHHELAGISLSMRIPPFWRDQPRLWFITFESATADLKKSQSQLAQMVIAQLEKQDVQQLTDLLYNPPEKDYYKAIKERLISLYEESDSERVQKLLSEMELGDQKPSQLLRRMRELAREKFPDDTIRIMWTKHLPPQIRSVLAVSETFKSKTTLDELARLADKMFEENHQIATVAAISAPLQQPVYQPVPQPFSNPDAQFIANELRRLSLEVAELKAGPRAEHMSRSFQRGRLPYRPRSVSRGRSRANSPMPYCFYHFKFGMDARRCTPPCSFKPIPPPEN